MHSVLKLSCKKKQVNKFNKMIFSRWAKETHDLFQSMWKKEDGGTLGISMITCMRVSSSEDYPEPLWKEVVYGFRSLTAKELQRLGKPSLR